MFRPFFVILCALVLSVMSACTSDVVPIYSSQPAFLRYAPVPTAPPLLSALTSPGQWCSITYTHLQINISAPGHTTITTPATALDVYGRPRSIAGFIVGTPSLPEATGLHEARAYDLVCPSCYRTLSIARALTLSATAPDRADCPPLQSGHRHAGKCRQGQPRQCAPLSLPLGLQSRPRRDGHPKLTLRLKTLQSSFVLLVLQKIRPYLKLKSWARSFRLKNLRHIALL